MASTTENVIATATEESKVSKTLPMKYKAMLCACLHVVSSYVPEEHREEIYGKLPLYNSIEEQVNYFETNVDIKRIETLIYKPMVKEHKRKEKESQKPIKEKKPKTPNTPNTPKEDKPKELKTPKKKKQDIAKEAEEILQQETPERVSTPLLPEEPEPVVNTQPQERVSTPLLCESQELEFENIYCNIDSPTVEGEPTHDIGAKTENKISNANENTPKPKPEKTKVVKKKEPKTDKPKVVKKKEPKTDKPKVVKKKEPKEASPDVEHYMVPPLVIPDGKYWTTDEHFQNGPLYNNKRDEDGDSIAGVLVGNLVNGVAVFEP
jgi:outer membrane biosynthesis protein TonB